MTKDQKIAELEGQSFVDEVITETQGATTGNITKFTMNILFKNGTNTVWMAANWILYVKNLGGAEEANFDRAYVDPFA